MARSVWKGPFVELSLLKKAETAQDAGTRHRGEDGRPVRGAPRADEVGYPAGVRSEQQGGDVRDGPRQARGRREVVAGVDGVELAQPEHGPRRRHGDEQAGEGPHHGRANS